MQTNGAGYKVPRDQFLSICKADNEFETAALSLCFDRMEEQENMILVWATASLTRRVAHIILMFADRLDTNLIYMTHEDWASIVGANRPAITNGINFIEGRKFIRSRRGQISVLDISGLRQMVTSSRAKTTPSQQHFVLPKQQH
jgi:hypothetical protein